MKPTESHFQNDQSVLQYEPAATSSMAISLKVLFISDVYFPRVNGVSTSIKTFIDQMHSLGHAVDLIAPEYPEHDVQDDDDWVTRIPARKIYFDPEDRLMKMEEAMALLPTLMAADYDIIHINTPFIAHYLGVKLAKRLGIPCVETYHTFFEDYLHHYLPWLTKPLASGLARFISKRQCNAVDAIIAPSEPMLDVLKDYGVLATSKVIPTGLQESSFQINDHVQFKQRYGIADDRPMLLYVGRVAYEKNIDFLLAVVNALKEAVPNLLLVITGEGPAESSLKALAKRLDIEQHVQFIGYLDRHDALNACYQSADVFVFASTSETQGLVILEAMAQATPVVAISALGTASLLVDGEGALIAEEDIADFADKVQQLLIDQSLRERLGELALQYVNDCWTAKKQAVRMLAFYQKMICEYKKNPQSTDANQVRLSTALPFKS